MSLHCHSPAESQSTARCVSTATATAVPAPVAVTGDERQHRSAYCHVGSCCSALMWLGWPECCEWATMLGSWTRSRDGRAATRIVSQSWRLSTRARDTHRGDVCRQAHGPWSHESVLHSLREHACTVCGVTAAVWRPEPLINCSILWRCPVSAPAQHGCQGSRPETVLAIPIVAHVPWHNVVCP